MSTTLKNIHAFIKESEKMKMTLRHCWMSNGRRESNAEHMWRLALMALVLCDELSIKIDMNHLIQILLVHDLPEIYTGDRPSWKKKLANKHISEAASLKKLIKDLPATTRKKLMSLWMEYRDKKTPESQVANALDKLEALIQHNQADIKTWTKIEKTPQYSTEYANALCEFDETIKELRAIIREETSKKLSL